MSKTTGLGDNMYVGGTNLSGDVGSISQIGGGPAVIEMPGIDVYAQERYGTVRSGRVQWVSWFNPTRAHPVLSALPTADTLVTYCRGTTLGAPAACCIGRQLNYDATRGADASLNFALDVQSDGYGLEWGVQLAAGPRVDAGPTDGGSVDLGAAGAFGAQFYLQVLDLDGTDVTVTIEQSSDDGVGDAFAAVTGGAFTAVTAAPAWQRIQTARDQAVERYLRAVTTGTFTTATISVVAVVNPVAVSF